MDLVLCSVNFFSLLSVAIFSLSIIFSTIIFRVPPLPSSYREIIDICNLLSDVDSEKNAVIYDLGSGWGDVLIALAKIYPEAEIRGIEISPVPYLFSIVRTFFMKNISISYGNFFLKNISDANIVICYLMPEIMDNVRIFLDDQLKNNQYVISNTFLFREQSFVAVRRGKSRGAVAIYRWGNGCGSPDDRLR